MGKWCQFVSDDLWNAVVCLQPSNLLIGNVWVMSHTLQSAVDSWQAARILQIDFSAALDRVKHQEIQVNKSDGTTTYQQHLKGKHFDCHSKWVQLHKWIKIIKFKNLCCDYPCWLNIKISIGNMGPVVRMTWISQKSSISKPHFTYQSKKLKSEVCMQIVVKIVFICRFSHDPC